MIATKKYPLRTLALGAAFSFSVFAAPARAGESPAPQPPPKSWIDPDTGHRVIRLTDEPNSASFYFNVNAYTPDGKEMAFTTDDGGIGVVNLTTFANRMVVQGRVRAIIVGRKTPRVFYLRENALYATNVDTGETQKLADLPEGGSVSAINADETLAAGTRVLAGGAERRFVTSDGRGVQSLDKAEMMAQRLAARLPMEMFTIDLKTGRAKTILSGTDWFNHLQFSPTDPTLLMYCHEGSGWRVDRMWTIRTDGTENTMIPDEPGRNRIMETELAGHEWWSGDGRTIYVDLHLLKGVVGFLASYERETGKRVWYHYEQNEWCIHYNLSPDGTLFCGDGSGRPGAQWIMLLHPHRIPDDQTMGTDLIGGGTLQPERLVNMAKHNFRLEPNVSFTPDQRYLVFRSNMFGPTYAFAVEVAKAGGAERAGGK
ncbi:MAG TPA: oligogalacturonate lyase family protein [Opitutaceae bacterium]|nr:oligogalacturonate lyase family protein [Opitutaceae bacterium]